MGGHIWPDSSVRSMPYPGEWPGGFDPKGLDPRNPPPELVPFTPPPEKPKPPKSPITLSWPFFGDLCIGVEGDLVGITGVEGGAGIVIGLDTLLDSGLYITIAEMVVGMNVGCGVGGFYTPGDVEGGATGVDVNIPAPFPFPVRGRYPIREIPD